MIIAIVEDDKDYQGLLVDLFHGKHWDVTFFNDAKEFGLAVLKRFDVIIADCHLPGVTGQALLKTIANKTSAALALMTCSGAFSIEDTKLDYVSNLLNKAHPTSILEWLVFIEVKNRLSAIMQKTEETYTEITAMTNGLRNGYHAEVKNSTLVIGLSNLLSEKSKKTLLTDFEEYQYKAVFYYEDSVRNITSIHLDQLAEIWNVVRENFGRMALVKPKETLMELMSVVELDSLIHMAPSLTAAIAHIQE